MVDKSDGWRSDDWSLGWLKNLMTEASDDRIQVDWSLTCKHIIQNQSQQHVLRSCVENTLLFQTGGSGVLPHLQDCLHGEGLWHGGFHHQRALWRKLEVLNYANSSESALSLKFDLVFSSGSTAAAPPVFVLQPPWPILYSVQLKWNEVPYFDLGLIEVKLEFLTSASVQVEDK